MFKAKTQSPAGRRTRGRFLLRVLWKSAISALEATIGVLGSGVLILLWFFHQDAAHMGENWTALVNLAIWITPERVNQLVNSGLRNIAGFFACAFAVSLFVRGVILPLVRPEKDDAAKTASIAAYRLNRRV
ncbi:hypothetical protein F6X40_11315 [Paraburkholderia sp. UCT31]|uniref:hypothetical protein n=1 Tax=Paraburkholderia sp. UCT31 TaxID=2615209 RepID=UPI0016559EC5|nr:hypothetical protein [Paraburkholderia sp. UCT31]MBC8737393.1 hypothetical protein [Paraburkholderia sp. UCT31]